MTDPGPWAEALWLTIGLGLVVYAVTGGADLGAGLWSLFARGPRRQAQREAVHHALAPIWEANHVWLIFVIVVLFSAFPRAFAVLGIALHVPIGLALVGIVLRGAAYSFHAYGLGRDEARRRWERVFAAASAATPFFLGLAVGGVSSGDIRVADGTVTSGWLAGWTTPFAALVGLFALALFALLAAVYLAAEAEDEALAADFRHRAIISEGIAGAFAAAVFLAARTYAPALYRNLAGAAWTWPVQIATALAALATIYTLWQGNAKIARYTAAAQAALVVAGWGLAMDHHFILPDVSIANAGARPEVLPALTLVLAGGAVVLVPALYYLYRVFKLGSRPAPKPRRIVKRPPA